MIWCTLQSNATISPAMISTFASTINLILMFRAIAEYIIGIVCFYTLNLISIKLEHEWSYIARNFVLLNYSIQAIKAFMED